MYGNEDQNLIALVLEENLGPEFILQTLSKPSKDEKTMSIPREPDHLNPFRLYLLAEIPRFQPGEFFKFSSQYHDKLIVRTRKDFSTTLMNLFSMIAHKSDKSIFMVGPYSKVKTYVSELSDEKGEKVLGVGHKLDWLALTPNPYLVSELSDEFPEYDKYREFPNSRWLEAPNGDNTLTQETLLWLIEISHNDKFRRDHSFYLGTERLQPDYSRERFLEDYRGILAAIFMVNPGGYSLFEVLWPVNDYALGLIGLIGLFYDQVITRKQINLGPDNPLIVVYASGRKPFDPALASVLANPKNFESILTSTASLYNKQFIPHLKKQKLAVEKRVLELRNKKFL